MTGPGDVTSGLAPHVAGRPSAEVRLPPAARTVRCPVCNQPAGQSCRARKWQRGRPEPAYLPRYHRERWDAAKGVGA